MSNTQDNSRPSGPPPPDPRAVDPLPGDAATGDPSSGDRLTVDVNLGQGVAPEQREAIIGAVRAAAAYRGCRQGTIGVAVVDDAAIQAVNRRHLQHDYPTDVISFTYQLDPPHVEGELVVSWQTAERASIEAGWPAAHELILYVVHGALHITGMDDASSDQRQAMRAAERAVLAQLGIDQPAATAADAGTATPAAGGRRQ